MLIKLINNDPLDVQVFKMPTKLVVRNSCQAPAKKAEPRKLAQ
jgi:DNA-binding LacI/PurR family transcriptional regulator